MTLSSSTAYDVCDEKLSKNNDTHEQTLTFLNALFADKPGDDFIYIWTGKKSTWFQDINKAGDFARRIQDDNVYFGIATSPTDNGAYKRVLQDTVSGISCLWLDLDYGKDGHKKKNNPPTYEDALALLDGFVKPSLIVHSGHGFQVYWLFNEFYSFKDDADRARAAALSKKLNDFFREVAKKKGWDVDSTQDLARVYRVPGTMNVKPELPPVPCEIISPLGKRFSVAELEDELDFRLEIMAEISGEVKAKPVAVDNLVARSKPAKSLTDDVYNWLNSKGAQKLLKGVDRSADFSALVFGAFLKFGDYEAVVANAHECARVAGVQRYIDENRAEKEICRVLDKAVSAGVLAKRVANGHTDYSDVETPEAYSAALKAKKRANLTIVRPGEDEDEIAVDADGVIQENFVSGNAAKKFNLTDMGNAERFADKYSNDFKFVKSMGGWLHWNGQRWELDTLSAVEQAAKQTVRCILSDASQTQDPDERNRLAKWALQSENGTRIDQIVKLAKSEATIAENRDVFDTNHYSLTVANGTINLKTGELKPHKREDMITKLAPVEFDDLATCPTWLAFLNKVMDGKADMIEFLQRAVGHSLTGDNNEHVVFFLYGDGENGKSTFLETIQALLGEYAVAADPNAFLTKDGGGNGSPRNDIVALVGSRFVKVVEPERGRNLAESLVKELSGGDTSSTRGNYSSQFSFEPTFKLWFSANHKITIKNQDNGIWRRMRFIPFSVAINAAERDKNLKTKLKAELPGILNWALQGCLKWQKDGLKEPTDVRAATKKYREGQDTIGQFITETCEVSKNVKYKVLLRDLYTAYDKWCDDGNERKLGKLAFSENLEGRKEFRLEIGAGGMKRVCGLSLKGLSQVDITD